MAQGCKIISTGTGILLIACLTFIAGPDADGDADLHNHTGVQLLLLAPAS